MDTKNYTQVLIDGKVYTLGGSEDESYLQKAASYVNEKNSAMRKVPGFTKQSADYQMVMTELNIADDYFKAVEWAEGMERQKNDMEKEMETESPSSGYCDNNPNDLGAGFGNTGSIAVGN